MPLIHSKKPAAFSKNVSTEMHAGKPQKQAVAIAYSVKAKAEHRKHLDEGGETAANEKEPHEVSAESHEPEGEKDEGEIDDMIGHEFMDALHSKDHKRIMGAIEATVLRHLSKKDESDA